MTRDTLSRQAAERAGRTGEAMAAGYLRGQGWRILAERVRTKAGEVDLIVARDGLIAFVEVKLRMRASELDFAIDERRLARVAAAAEILAPRYARAGEDIRIDVLLICPGHAPRHIENAWIG